MEYKIGQILTSLKDVEVEEALSGEKVVIPKGNRIIIGADRFAHHLRDGMIQPLGDATVQNYDTTGSAEYLLLVLKSHFPVSEMMEAYGIEDKEIQDEIECALEDIGF